MEIYFDGKQVNSYESTGFHTVEQAVETAFDSFVDSNSAEKNIEDYVFRVTNLADNTSARYRVNAGGNVKLIPEE